MAERVLSSEMQPQSTVPTSAVPTPAATQSSSVTLKAKNAINRFLTTGGALWIAHYVLQLVMGLSEGKVSMNSRFSPFDGFCFMAAIVCFCIGLGWLSTQIRPRTALAVTGLTFAIIAGVAIIVGAAAFMWKQQAPGVLGAVGVVGSCLSATFAALAARRTNALPPRLANLLLLIGLLTFPLIVAFTWPGQFVPSYLTDELPFALSGIAYITFARGLSRSTIA
ncbi:MAG TPA: hypothetical protein VF600_13500 [Abditibacteriaceae bacterium]|jgi:hypothetical protein